MSDKIVKKDVQLAVLIDADNVSPHHIKNMVNEIARYGNPTIKRIYGDWTKPNLARWKHQLLDFAISPIQQFGYTTGKNSTDSAMIIDAMDILYADKVDGFVIVSSDSDFTKLATRLREAGKIVYGLGERKTPNAFIAACDRFIYLEILSRRNYDGDASSDAEDKDLAQSGAGKSDTAAKKRGATRSKRTISDKEAGSEEKALVKVERQLATRRSTKTSKSKSDSSESDVVLKIDRNVINLITSSIRDVEEDDGWAFLAEIGNILIKKQPSFDSRNYGFDKLTSMIRSIDKFEVQFRETGNPNIKLVYVRVRDL